MVMVVVVVGVCGGGDDDDYDDKMSPQSGFPAVQSAELHVH